VKLGVNPAVVAARYRLTGLRLNEPCGLDLTIREGIAAARRRCDKKQQR
jgi:hypothetical protein